MYNYIYLYIYSQNIIINTVRYYIIVILNLVGRFYARVLDAAVINLLYLSDNMIHNNILMQNNLHHTLT